MMSMLRSSGWACALLVVWVAASPPASADGSVEAGTAKVAVCIACHGPNGNSINEQWPSLAGQNAAYVAGQIKQFHDNTRINSNGVMLGMVASLSDQDAQDIGAYFAAQTPTGLEADPSYWKAGRALYRGGDGARKIPACMACHGPVGRGNPAAGYPALRAQHAVYTVKQLTEYAAGKRYSSTPKGDSAGGPNSDIMHAIAGRLTPEDMRNVASYVQGMR